MHDVARWELRGAVQTLRTQFAEWDAQTGNWRPLRHRFVATFRADGQLSEVEHHDPDGSVRREVRCYDGAGRLTEAQWWSNDSLTRRVVRTYDDAGRLASAVTVDEDGNERESERCHYDESGSRSKIVVLPVPETSGATCSAGSRGIVFGVDGTDVAYAAPGATTSTTIYDEHDRPSEVTFHDASGAPVSRVVLSWDDEGRLLSERMEFAGPRDLLGQAVDANVPADERASLLGLLQAVFEDQTFSLATYAYDKKGHRIETLRRIGTLSEERVTVRYDAFDNPLEEVTSNVRCEVRMDGGVVNTEEGPSHVQQVRFEYQYDARGNWTERTVWQRLEPNADEWPSTIERRTIAYYAE